nr:hypothetical protein [Breoghania sp.]
MTKFLSICLRIADTSLPRDLAALVALSLVVSTAAVWVAVMTGEM